jgi:hypothetical protein
MMLLVNVLGQHNYLRDNVLKSVPQVDRVARTTGKDWKRCDGKFMVIPSLSDDLSYLICSSPHALACKGRWKGWACIALKVLTSEAMFFLGKALHFVIDWKTCGRRLL